MSQMTLNDFGISTKVWKYDEDTGHMMCRCPECRGRMTISFYAYWNPYKFCPYCGVRLEEGDFVRRCCQIYGRKEANVIRVRQEYNK